MVGGAVIRYEYRVQGTHPGVLDVDDEHADEVLHSYPLGTHVTVYYEPDRPSESSLERAPAASLLAPIVSSALDLAVLAAAILWFRRARSKATPPVARG